MAQTYLIINVGSGSKSFHVFEHTTEIYATYYQRYGTGFHRTIYHHSEKKVIAVTEDEFNDASRVVAQEIHDILPPINACGVRIVAPGTFFSYSRLITDEFMAKLNAIQEQVPMDISSYILTELEAWKKLLPDIPFVGVSDSAFHRTIPTVAREYAITHHDTIAHDLFRFGYHGISLQSIMHRVDTSKNYIICHLGGGTSVTAIKQGKSVDTSMGYSPLEGVIMATRGGNIDPEVVLYLQTYVAPDIRTYLNMKCGLLGLSELSADIRVLLEAEKQGHEGARRALDAYAYTICKQIGAYLTILPQVHMIIFTGSIGVKLPEVRTRILAGLNILEIALDADKNTAALQQSSDLASAASKCEIASMDAQEEAYMVIEVNNVLGDLS